MNNYLLFPPKERKNRRFTPYEMQTEREICQWLKRPPRHFVNDTPFYPWCVPEPKVNFDLVTKWKNKGQQ